MLNQESLDTINKLIVLFVFDKMNLPVTDHTILELVTSRNNWLSYLDCNLALGELADSGFLYNTKQDTNDYYAITPDGKACIADLYDRIPSQLQQDITDFVNQNRLNLRRNQEYFRHYHKNADGTYTIVLKIIDPTHTPLELKLVVPNRQVAKQVYENWEKKAAKVYLGIHEQLIGT